MEGVPVLYIRARAPRRRLSNERRLLLLRLQRLPEFFVEWDFVGNLGVADDTLFSIFVGATELAFLVFSMVSSRYNPNLVVTLDGVQGVGVKSLGLRFPSEWERKPCKARLGSCTRFRIFAASCSLFPERPTVGLPQQSIGLLPLRQGEKVERVNGEGEPDFNRGDASDPPTGIMGFTRSCFGVGLSGSCCAYRGPAST